MRYLFEILYRVNKILYQFGKRRITKKDRLDVYSTMRKEGFFKALQIIYEISKNKIEEEEQLKAAKKIGNECKKVFKEYQDELLDYKFFDSVEKKLDKKSLEDLSETEQEIVRKYRLDSMAETEENLGIKKMASSYAKDQLLLVYKKVQNGYGEIQKANNFTGEVQSIIDMRA